MWQVVLEFIIFMSSLLMFGCLMVYLGISHKPTSVRKTLLIDDMRNIKADKVARTFDEGIHALLNEGPWEILYLDHDLGDPDPRKTGYDIINFLEANPSLLPDRILLVTDNPVGRKKMQMVIDKLYGGNHERN